MSDAIDNEQRSIAARVGVEPLPPVSGTKIGIARNVRDGIWPINGLRHAPVGGTCGWYVWAGERFSDAPDFFVPLHIEHLVEWCPLVIPYLELPPGWRFLNAPGYEDVWYDESLL